MKRILIIDDNAAVREYFCDLLTDSGYHILSAEDGDHGIQLQRDTPVDLVITDLCMPRKSGIEVIETLTKEFPKLKIIAISGGPGSQATTGFTVYEQMLEAALEVGAALTLTKPINKNELLNHIQTLLEQ